jgi:hypothetical protein
VLPEAATHAFDELDGVRRHEVSAIMHLHSGDAKTCRSARRDRAISARHG